MLETVPGLHVSTARGISDVFVIRGIFSENNAQVLVMINNIPVSDAVDGGRPQTWRMPVFKWPIWMSSCCCLIARMHPRR